MHILIPLDGSELAENALESAAALAQQMTSPVTLVLMRVNTTPSALIDSYASLTMLATIVDDGEALCREYLQHIKHRLSLSGLTIETLVTTGSPATAIHDLVRKQPIDLIIMTSHGRSGIAQTLWGSVAQSIVRTCGVPTLVLRQPTMTFFAANQDHPFTILVPLDGSVLAEAILPTALLIAKSGGTLYLVRIIPATSTLDVMQQAADYLERIQRSVEAHGVTARFSVQQGEPAPIIEQMVQQLHPALLAMATHGRIGLDQLLRGSTTQTVLHHLTLPILVVHPTLTPEEVTMHALLNVV